MNPEESAGHSHGHSHGSSHSHDGHTHHAHGHGHGPGHAHDHGPPTEFKGFGSILLLFALSVSLFVGFCSKVQVRLTLNFSNTAAVEVQLPYGVGNKTIICDLSRYSGYFSHSIKTQ